MATDPNGLWAWQQQAAAQNPSLYGFQQRQLSADDLNTYRPYLQAQGLWNPAWDAYIANQGVEGGIGGDNQGANMAGPDMSSLNGLTLGEARSQDRYRLQALFDPSGQMVSGTQRAFEGGGGAWKSADWKNAAAVIGGVLAAGYGASALAGSAGAGAGAAGAAEAGVAGTTGATGAGTISGGSGLTVGAGTQAATGFGTAAGTTAGAGGGSVLGAAAAGGSSWVVPAISTVGGLASSYMQGQATERAAAIQAQAAKEGQATQLAMFEAMQKGLSPYVTAGNDAMAQQRALAGLDGPQAQQAAIAAIQGGPQFTAMQQLGENRIRANASASGGLRGGNFQSAMAQFSPQLLSSLIEQQYSRLGGMSQLGQASAAGVGSAGITTGQGISNLQQQGGAAMAGGALAQGRVNAGYWGTIANGLGMYAGLSGGW